MTLELIAKEILETGNIQEFEEYIVANSDKIEINYSFEEQASFLIILVQTFRKIESLNVDRNEKIPVDDYRNAMTFLVEVGCDLQKKDVLGRTVGHWAVLLKSLELLSFCLRLGYNALLQDNEGQTIAHIAVRHMDQMALETIKVYTKDPTVLDCPSNTSGATPLIYAVQIDAVDIVQKLLQLSVDINTQETNKYKRTALHYALLTDNEEIFELLLKHKARTDIKDYKNRSVIDNVVEHPKDTFLRTITHYSSSDIFASGDTSTSGFSPLMTACKNNDFDMLCELLKYDEEKKENHLMMLDSDLRSVLHYCADNTDERCAEKILNIAPELIVKKDKNGFVALHLASISNNVKLVELLLKMGCEVKEKDNDGHTSLHWAVVCCSLEIISILIIKEPEIIHMSDNFGASPLHYATQTFLNPNGAVQGPKVFDEILKNGKNNLNCVDDENRTPLLWAACLGIPNCCEILLENGADINHKDKKGLTALHCAASRGHYDIVELLVNTWSVSVDCEDDNLCTPLFYAVTLKHMEIVQFLLEKRCNPNQKDIKGRSAAHCAALKGYCDILNMIYNEGGSIYLENNDGDLPLHEAAETGKLEVCKLLLEKMEELNKNALINVVNKQGYTALHKAAQNNNNEICKLLLEYGADPNIYANMTKDPSVQVTPLDLATDAATMNVLKNADGCLKRSDTSDDPRINDILDKPLERNLNSFEDGKRENEINIEIQPKRTVNSTENLKNIDKMSSVTFRDRISKHNNVYEKNISRINRTDFKEEDKLKEYQITKKIKNEKFQRATIEPKVLIHKDSSSKRTFSRSTIRSSTSQNARYFYPKPNQQSRTNKVIPDTDSPPTLSSHPTPCSSIAVQSESNTQNMYVKIIESVKEYRDIRNRMRSISNRRRMEMFEGFSKSANLSKRSVKSRIPKSTKKYAAFSEENGELPQITSTDFKVYQKPKLTQLSSEEQIKSAYQCDLSLSTLVLY